MAADVSCGGRLPPDFNYGVTRDGRVFFIDERHKDTTWLHPLNGRPVQTGFFSDPGLPDGWEQGVTQEGSLYYIDHNTRTTSFQHPVTGRSHGDLPYKSFPPNTSRPKTPTSPPSPASPADKSFKRNQAKQRSLKAPTAKRNPSSRIIRRAWLYRWETSGLSKTWKKRWCVLVDFALFIYKDEHEENAVASVLLPSYRINIVLPTEPVFRQFAFKLEHDNTKTLYFATDSTSDLENWLSLLRHEAMMKGHKGLNKESNNNKSEKLKPEKLIPKSPIISHNNDTEDDEPLFPDNLKWQDPGSYRRLHRKEDVEPPPSVLHHYDPHSPLNHHASAPSRTDNRTRENYPDVRNSQYYQTNEDHARARNSFNPRDVSSGYVEDKPGNQDPFRGQENGRYGDREPRKIDSTGPRDIRNQMGSSHDDDDPYVSIPEYSTPHRTNNNNNKDYHSQHTPQFRNSDFQGNNYDPWNSDFQGGQKHPDSNHPRHNEDYGLDPYNRMPREIENQERNPPVTQEQFQGREKRMNPSYFDGNENTGTLPHSNYPKGEGYDNTMSSNPLLKGYSSLPWNAGQEYSGNSKHQEREGRNRRQPSEDRIYPEDDYRSQNPNSSTNYGTDDRVRGSLGDRLSRASDQPTSDDYNRYGPSGNQNSPHHDSKFSDHPSFDPYHGDRTEDQPPYYDNHGVSSPRPSSQPPFNDFQGDRNSRASDHPSFDGYGRRVTSQRIPSEVPDYSNHNLQQPGSGSQHIRPHPELTVNIPHTYVNLPTDRHSGDSDSSGRRQDKSPGRPPYPAAVREEMAKELAQSKTPITSNDYITAAENEKKRMQQKEYFQYPTPSLLPDQNYPQHSQQQMRTSMPGWDQTDNYTGITDRTGNYNNNHGDHEDDDVPEPGRLHKTYGQELYHKQPSYPANQFEESKDNLRYGSSSENLSRNPTPKEREMHNKSRDSWGRDSRFNQPVLTDMGRDQYQSQSQENLERQAMNDHTRHGNSGRDSFDGQGRPSHHKSLGSMERFGSGGYHPSSFVRPLRDIGSDSQSMGNLERQRPERSPPGRDSLEWNAHGTFPKSKPRERDSYGRGPDQYRERDRDSFARGPYERDSYTRSPYESRDRGSFARGPNESRERDSYPRSPNELMEGDSFARSSHEPRERDSFARDPNELRERDRFARSPHESRERDSFARGSNGSRERNSYSRSPNNSRERDSYARSPNNSRERDSYARSPNDSRERDSYARSPNNSRERDSYARSPNESRERDSFARSREDFNLEGKPRKFINRDADENNPKQEAQEMRDAYKSIQELQQRQREEDYSVQLKSQKKKPELSIHTVKEDPDMLDTDVLETRRLQSRNKKYPLNGNRLRMSISAGDLIGKTHDELVLLLIQLRRNQSSLEKARDYYRESLDKRRTIEREYRRQRNDSTGRLEESLEENHQSFLDFKRELEEIENKLEVYKPLINLVDNMVTMGSLYGGDNLMLATQYRRHLLRPDQFTEPKRMLEFSRENQERRFVKEIEDEIKQLSSDEVDLEEKLEKLYDLDRKLQEQSFKVTSYREDKEILEKALSGILQQQDKFRNNPRELNRLMSQQRTIERELSHVMQQLAVASQELEETTAENNRIEHEVTLLRTKVNGELTRSKSTPSLAGEGAHAKMKMEKELAKVQNMMAGLSNEGARLKEAMTTLRRSSSGTQIAAMLEKEEAATTKKKPSSYLITDLDTNETFDASKSNSKEETLSSAQTTYLTSAPDQRNSGNSVQYSSNPDYGTDSDQVNQMSEMGDSMATNRPIISHQRQDSFATGSDDDSDNSMIVDPDAPDVTWDISDAEDNTKRFFGIIPKEKSKVLTVRDVKRQHDQRKERDKMKKETDDCDVGGCYSVSGNNQVPQEHQESQDIENTDNTGDWYSSPNSINATDTGPLYENLPRPRPTTTPAEESPTPNSAPSSAPNSRRPSIVFMAPKPFTRYEDRQSVIVTAKPFTARPFKSETQLNFDLEKRFQPVRFDPSAAHTFSKQRHYSELNLKTNSDFLTSNGQQTASELSPREHLNSDIQPPWLADAENSVYSVKRSPKGRFLTISSTEPVKLESKNWSKSTLHSVAGDLITNKPIDNVPDIVKSSTKTIEMELYDEFTIDRELYRPGPVDIPERYNPDSDEEDISEEDKLKRLEKAEKIKKLLAQQSVHSLSQPDISNIGKQGVHRQAEMEKFQRSHLLGLGQELARQVTVKSKEAAAKRRKTWSGGQFSEAMKSQQNVEHFQEIVSPEQQDMYV